MMDSKVDFESSDGVKVTVTNPEHYTPSGKGGDEINPQGGNDKWANGAPDEGSQPPSNAEKNIKRTIESTGPISKTQQQKLDHSFAEYKRKVREREAELKNRIAELEKQIAKKPEKKDYEDEEKYFDARLDYRDAQKELNGAKRELEGSGINSNLQIFAERAKILYPNQESQKRYSEAFSKGRQNGAVDTVFGDRMITDFIHDSQFGPIILEHFCHKPEFAEKIAGMSDARKSVELVSLEQRLMKFLQGMAQKKQQGTQTGNKVQVTAPIVGAPTNKGASGNVGDKNRFSSDDEVFKYLRNH